MTLNKKPLVLLVDDDPLMIESVQAVIEDAAHLQGDERLSCNLLTARSGLEALEVMNKYKRWGGLAKHRIDCIILDIKMPKMDGLEFLHKWRGSESFYLVPVILLSAYEDEEKWAKATDVTKGVVAKYLQKPIEHDYELLEPLRRLLLDHQAEDMIDETREAGYSRRKYFRDQGDH